MKHLFVLSLVLAIGLATIASAPLQAKAASLGNLEEANLVTEVVSTIIVLNVQPITKSNGIHEAYVFTDNCINNKRNNEIVSGTLVANSYEIICAKVANDENSENSTFRNAAVGENLVIEEIQKINDVAAGRAEPQVVVMICVDSQELNKIITRMAANERVLTDFDNLTAANVVYFGQTFGINANHLTNSLT